MDRRKFLQECAVTLGALGTGALFLSRCGNVPGNHLPNIVLILADDMGYGDIRAYNPESRIPTPRLNRLAEEGMRFTDAHAGAAVCSPTRYGLLTGCYCWRSRLKSGVLWPPDDKPLIEEDRLTLAGLLKQKGYHSTCIGKWHVGFEWGLDDRGEVDFNKPLRYGPTDTGFDEFFGIAGSLDMVPYVFYRDHEPTEPVKDTQPGLPFPRFIREGPRAGDFDPARVLDRLVEEAVSYIERRTKVKSPFFLYLPLTAPHKPVWPTPEFAGTTGLGPYGDFIRQVDTSVGQVLDALEKNGLSENTLVIYTSDNGSYMYRFPEEREDHVTDPSAHGFHPSSHQANGIWRGTKADVWEAGHRVPFIARWPGTVPKNSRNHDTVCLTDVFATFADLTGLSIPANAGEDSFSLLPLMRGEEWPDPRAPVIHHSSNGIFSLRDGKWKMVFGNGSGGREKPAGKPFEKPYFLFDLENDPSETTNIIDRFPEIARRMTEKLEKIMENPGSRF
jgi:arylsulfatase A-like enzyme